MAIAPPSDIVLDVVNAANPAARAAGAARLAALQTGGAGGVAPVGMPFDAVSAAVARRNSYIVNPTAAPPPRPFKQFEAMVLQNFLSGVLPKSETNAFGQGTAGSVARGWMAEAVARQLAESGGIGIADTIAARQIDPVTSEPRTVAFESVATQPGEVVPVADVHPFSSFLGTLANVLAGLFSAERPVRAGDDQIKLSR